MNRIDDTMLGEDLPNLADVVSLREDLRVAMDSALWVEKLLKFAEIVSQGGSPDDYRSS
jgi:hypothetical protein